MENTILNDIIKPKVLVVEDEKIIALDIVNMLERLGFETTGTAAKGTDALDLLSKGRTDVVLMDIILKGEMDGIECAQIIDEKFDIPVIFVTAHQDIGTVEKSKYSNPYGFLAKPIEERDLNTCIKNGLYRKDSEKKLREMQEKYFRLAENAKDMIFRYSLQTGTFEYVNKSSKAITGFPPEYFYSNPSACLEFINIPSANNGDEWNKWISDECEYSIVDAAGKSKWLNAGNVVIFDESGEPTAIEGIIKDVSERRLYEEKLTAANQQLHALAEHIESIREDERLKISHEIHDQLGADMTVIKVELYLLSQKIHSAEQPVNPAEIDSSFKRLANMADGIIGKIRNIASRLRPDVLDRLGLEEAAEWLLEENQKRTGIKGKLEHSLHDVELKDPIPIQLFRVLQELIINTVRHANASSISVKMLCTDSVLNFSYEDDGIGMEKEEAENRLSFGIMGIKERVRLLNGNVSFCGRKGSGILVQIQVPLNNSIS